MKLTVLALTGLCLLPAAGALAQTHEPHIQISRGSAGDLPSHMGPRYSARDADLAITTTTR
jgi:hypothetical protein